MANPEGTAAMIELAEHFYHDDPARGHPDVRTRLPGVSYFFLGNGYLLAALQVVRGREGTPLGLLLSDPDRLGPKRDVLTMDPAMGLAPTLLRVTLEEGATFTAGNGAAVFWSEVAGIPAVEAHWEAGPVRVAERFWCPDRTRPVLVRGLELVNSASHLVTVRLTTGAGGQTLESGLELPPQRTVRFGVRYELRPAEQRVVAFWTPEPAPDPSAVAWWGETARLEFGDPLLDRLFEAARRQLPAVVSAAGVVDASIWQYQREWVRDHAFMAAGLVRAGCLESARSLLERLLEEFVEADGATVDSSEHRPPEEVELDQNGVLLAALALWTDWTGDIGPARRHWVKVAALAEYPLRPDHRHPPSGLLWSAREFWERHAGFGIKPGLELIYQVFTVVGLRAAASLAGRLGHTSEAERWTGEAGRLLHTIMEDPDWRLHDEGGFFKRRGLDGRPQRTIDPGPLPGLPAGLPLITPGPHRLDPDTCTALPIALGLVDPASESAGRTLEGLEALWNQGWTGGGYGRYHVSSEPDSPGAWPFPSLFVARACHERREWSRVRRILEWLGAAPGSEAGSWFENHGPRIAPPFPQVGIPPWTWAEVLDLLVHHLAGVRPGSDELLLRPRPLPGLERISGSLPLRGGRLQLDLRFIPGVRPAWQSNAELVAEGEAEVRLRYPEGDLVVSAILPATPTPTEDA
jgi:hypothetical protein